jgi:hypothetical protein
LAFPIGIEVYGNGNLIVACYSTKTILFFDSNHKFCQALKVPACPYELALSPSGILYVVTGEALYQYTQ